jgi:hypothetical protein
MRLMAEQISTKPLIDKLGVTPGARVSLLGLGDETFAALLRSRTSDISGRVRGSSDLIFLAADDAAALERLEALRARIVPDGAIWVVSRKGRAATLRDVDVIDAAKRAGLVDNKVVSFSETHTALRLVIPRSARPHTR